MHNNGCDFETTLPSGGHQAFSMVLCMKFRAEFFHPMLMMLKKLLFNYLEIITLQCFPRHCVNVTFYRGYLLIMLLYNCCHYKVTWYMLLHYVNKFTNALKFVNPVFSLGFRCLFFILNSFDISSNFVEYVLKVLCTKCCVLLENLCLLPSSSMVYPSPLPVFWARLQVLWPRVQWVRSAFIVGVHVCLGRPTGPFQILGGLEMKDRSILLSYYSGDIQITSQDPA